MPRTLALLLTATLAGVLGAVRPADGRSQDNAAIAINTRDGAAVFRFAFKIQRVAGDVVDSTNAAVSYASCTDCQTVATAIQVVLVMDEPSVATPENWAIAINQECTLCETLASAYQFVFGTGGPVRFTAEGNQALAQLRREFQELRQQAPEMSIAEVQARIAKLVDRLRVVLEQELVAAGRAGDTQDSAAAPDAQPPPPDTTSTEPAPTATEPPPAEPPPPPPPPTDTTDTTDTTETTQTTTEP